jgi:hypothetical protein
MQDQKEQSGFTGGYIVLTYGSHKALPIDAIQLEFGAEYRVASKRKETAKVLADALEAYADLYLPRQSAAELKLAPIAKPALK